MIEGRSKAQYGAGTYLRFTYDWDWDHPDNNGWWCLELWDHKKGQWSGTLDFFSIYQLKVSVHCEAVSGRLHTDQSHLQEVLQLS
jgi:hypothetical protein